MKALRWIGIIFGVLVGVLVIAVATLYIMSNQRFNKVYEIPEISAIDIPTDEESLAEGERLYVSRGCGDCHLANGMGAPFFDAQPMGTLYASNLTSGEGGIGDEYTVEDYIRAIRHGVGLDSKPLYFMPAHEFGHFNDSDMGLLIAYMQSLEPVDNTLPEPNLGLLSRALFLSGQMPLIPAELVDHENVAPWDVEVAASVEYGEYMVQGCIGCHYNNYSGGPIVGADPSWPPATNITPHEDGLADWTAEDFAVAMRTGIRPDGSEINPIMPWGAFARLTDVELEAMYLYLQTLEPLPTGTR